MLTLPNARRKTMISRITLALALAITAFTATAGAIFSASARPGEYPYAPGYEDKAYNRDGW
jgi:hypothetical protein